MNILSRYQTAIYIKAPVLRGKDTPSPDMYDIIRVHCRNLVSVKDLWSPIPYMECGNLVTVNDSYGPPILYMEFGDLVTVNYSHGPPIPCMEYRNLVTVDASYDPPYLIWNVGTF